LDGQTVTSAAQLTKLLVPYHPGQKVQLGWEDQTGQSHATTVTLASGPPA
jgi:S1-C subfamily serine protease